MALKSGLKVPLLPSGRYCPLQTILLSDLVGCYSLLQIVMAVPCTFSKFEARQIAIIVSSGLHSCPCKFKLKTSVKCTKLPLLSAVGCHTRLDGQHCPLRTDQMVFFQRLRNPLKILIAVYFFMNKEGGLVLC